MNVLVIGSGGREHAICWKLQQSKKVSLVYAFPGSPAIAQLEKSKVINGLNLKDFQVGARDSSSLSAVVVISR
jgi:phosphoribosylamine-glycine ligase